MPVYETGVPNLFILTTPEWEAREWHRTHARLYGGLHNGEWVKINPQSPSPELVYRDIVSEPSKTPLPPWGLEVSEVWFSYVVTVYERRIWRYGNDRTTEEVRYYVRDD